MVPLENTTGEAMKNVRVEVHLSNGIELGPTIPKDLAPKEKILIKLTATSTDLMDGQHILKLVVENMVTTRSMTKKVAKNTMVKVEMNTINEIIF